MLKKSLLRGLQSYCYCVAVAVIVSLIVCLRADGQVTMPAFSRRFSNPMTAAMAQILLIGGIGFAFGAGSVLFEIERWSFLKQGIVHLALTAAAWIAVELICFTPVTLPSVVSMGLSAAATYAATWGAQYLVWRNKVRRLNDRIHQKNGEDSR